MVFKPVPEGIEVATLRVPRRYRAGKHMRRALMLIPLALLLDAGLFVYLCTIAQVQHLTDEEGIALGISMGAPPAACVLYFVFGFLYYLAMARSSYRAWVQSELGDRGGDARYLDTFFGPGIGSAIALDPRRRVLHVVGGRQFARIPWSTIRGWSWEVQGHERVQVLTGNLGAHAAASILNDSSRNAAARQSGMFVEVKDTKYPDIQFACTNVRLLKRWSEILRQVDEGAIA